MNLDMDVRGIDSERGLPRVLDDAEMTFINCHPGVIEDTEDVDLDELSFCPKLILPTFHIR